jgi:tRNA pseudouridine38-40 synthase
LAAEEPIPGVHARKFFAHFDADQPLDGIFFSINKSANQQINKSNFLYHLNSLLPRDISIINIHTVKEDAHARFDATSRTYEYVVVRRKDALLYGLSYQFEYAVDLKRMNQLAKNIFGST